MSTTENLIELLDAHDIVTESQDTECVLRMIEMLSANEIKISDTTQCSSLLAALNTCLHSKTCQGKVNGLIVLQWLCQECSNSMFNEQAVQWIKMTWSIMQKKSNLHLGALKLTFSVLRILVRRAPIFPDVARHLSTLVSPMIDVLVKYAESDLNNLSKDGLDTIQILLQTFPGSCGTTHGLIEKFIFCHLGGCSVMDSSLAKCLALMPRLGGGGKEGINHKANFVTLYQRLCYTLQDVLEEILKLATVGGASKKIHANGVPRAVDSFSLTPPPIHSNMLQKAMHLQRQFEALGTCLEELIAVPFPHPKSIRPGLLLGILKKVFDQSLPQFSNSANHSHEAKVLLLVAPFILASAQRLLNKLLAVCSTAMLPYAQVYMEVISGVFSDMRHFSDQSWVDLKVSTYQLLTQVCKKWGSAAQWPSSGKDIVAYVLSDIVPKNPGKMISTATKGGKKRQNKETNALWATLTNILNPRVTEVSMEAIAEFLQANGALLDEAVHKQLQCVLLAAALEPNSMTPVAKYHLYRALINLLSQGHYRATPSLHLLTHIFQKGLSEEFSNNSLAQNVCQRGLQLCLQQMHPGRSSLHLDLPLEAKTIEEVKSELMKVHVFYMDNGLVSEDNQPWQNDTANNEMQEEPEVATEPVSEEKLNGDQSQVSIEKEKLQQFNKANLKRFRDEDSKNLEEDNDEIPTPEEAKQKSQEIDNFSDDPIFIPEGLAQQREAIKQKSKVPRLTTEIEADKSTSVFLDAETMIKDFVPLFKS